MATPRILVPLAQGCEELEAVTITDLLTRAEFDVVTAGLDENPVTASRGMVLMPKTTMQVVMNEDFDMMVLPGGLPGANHLRDNELVQQKLKELAAQDKYIAAICAAPQALASAGILDNKTATGYPGILEKLQVPGMQLSKLPVVVDGKVVTSQGPGTAMDFALSLIELIAGAEKRKQVEQPLIRPSSLK